MVQPELAFVMEQLVAGVVELELEVELVLVVEEELAVEPEQVVQLEQGVLHWKPGEKERSPSSLVEAGLVVEEVILALPRSILD